MYKLGYIVFDVLTLRFLPNRHANEIILVECLSLNLIQILPCHYPRDYVADKPSNPRLLTYIHYVYIE